MNMGIKSGTLRKRLSESIKKKILCRNQLLLTIAYLHRYKTDDVELQKNIDDMENKLAELLVRYDGKEVKADIQNVINSITDRYIPSKQQAISVMKLIIKEEYIGYQRYFIKDSLLKFRRYSGKAKSKPKFNRLSAADLKN